MDTALIEDFDKTVALIKRAREELERHPIVEGQAGVPKASPWADILAQQQSHLRGLGRLLTVRGQEQPIPDDAMSNLLD